MDHPSETQLQRYLDGELDDGAEEQIRSHLQACAPCRALYERHARLSALVRSACPEPEAFCSDGEFWVRLAARLTPRPAPRWSLLPLLPPVLLAGFGLTLEVVFTLVVGAFGLAALGLLPAPAALLTEEMPVLLGSPLLESTLYAWLGWSSEEVIEAAAMRWGAMSAAAQHAILLGGLLMGLLVALSVVEVLYLTWAMCWPGTARREMEGGS